MTTQGSEELDYAYTAAQHEAQNLEFVQQPGLSMHEGGVSLTKMTAKDLGGST